MSAVRRMLNVDQAPVLMVDESAGTIELNRALLLQQFRVGRSQVPPAPGKPGAPPEGVGELGAARRSPGAPR